MKIEKPQTQFKNMNGVRLHILDGGHASGAREWAGKVNSPAYARLYYICGGDPYLTAAGCVTKLESGRCYLLPAGLSFQYACRTGMEQLFFHVQLLDDAGTDLLRGCREILAGTPGQAHIRWMIELTKDDSLCGSLKLRQELYATILAMLEQNGVQLGRTQYSCCVRRAAAYIQEHLSLQLTVGELALHAGVSESTLEKAFRVQTGMTIGRYIDETIFLKAEDRLRYTDISVAQMSEEMGFCDQFYFSRRFRERYGLSPQRYRKAFPI